MSDSPNTMTHNSVGQIDLFKLFMGFFMTLTTTGVFYVGSNMIAFQVSIAEINRDIANLNISLTEFKEDAKNLAANRYTSGQALADARVQSAQDANQNGKIDRSLEWNARLSDRLTKIEELLRENTNGKSR